jgi:hypothetical protein
MRPLSGMPAAKLALRALAVLITPRQFGPTTRMPYRWAISITSRSNWRPSAPVSRKPAVIMMAAPTPFSPQSSITPATTLLGTTITARSTGSGTSVTRG